MCSNIPARFVKVDCTINMSIVAAAFAGDVVVVVVVVEEISGTFCTFQ